MIYQTKWIEAVKFPIIFFNKLIYISYQRFILVKISISDSLKLTFWDNDFDSLNWSDWSEDWRILEA